MPRVQLLLLLARPDPQSGPGRPGVKWNLQGWSSVTRLRAREGDQHFCWTEDTGLPSEPQVQNRTHADSQARAGTGRAPEAGTAVLPALPRPGRAEAQRPGQAGRGGLGPDIGGLGSYHWSSSYTRCVKCVLVLL